MSVLNKQTIVDDIDRAKAGLPPLTPIPEPKKPRAKKKQAVKLCVKCQASPPLTEFYKNSGWAEQAYHDAWCKSCVRNYSTTKETLREYCFRNNRAWKEDLWEKAKEAARYKLATNDIYLRAGVRKKEQMENPLACITYIQQMNLSNNYTYSDNIQSDSGYMHGYSDSPVSGSDEDPMVIDSEVTYNPEWNGMFSGRELKYLNNYYQQLEQDFALDDVSMRDYARKVAKASLTYDDVYNKHKSGNATSRELSEAKSNFDELSKSANFAACRRRVDDKTMVMPLGLIAEYLEANNKIHARKDDWEQDSVDQMILEMRHISTSLGLDVGGGPSD